MPPSGGSATSRRMSSRSGTRASLPESTAEEKRVDDALRKHRLVSHEATIFNDDPVHCFFHAFLDGWACIDSPTRHLDIFALRQDAKKWLRDNYELLKRKGIIEDWLMETVYRKSQKPRMANFLQWIRSQWLPANGHTPTYGRHIHVHCSGKYLLCYRQCSHWIGGSDGFCTLYGCIIFHH
jgi:hypothetical protein